MFKTVNVKIFLLNRVKLKHIKKGEINSKTTQGDINIIELAFSLSNIKPLIPIFTKTFLKLL